MGKLLMILAIVWSSTSMAQMPDSVQKYIDTALIIMQTRALAANEIDWVKTRETAFALVPEAKSYKDAFPAISFAFQQLKDHHGMWANEDTMYKYPAPFNLDSLISKGVKEEYLKGNRIVTRFFEQEQIAYLRIPGMIVFKQVDIDLLANRLRDSLCMLLSKKPKGMVIDLRMNAGGNSAPMISGVSPIFGDGIVGYGVDKDKNISSTNEIKNGILIDDNGQPLAAVKQSCQFESPIKIAVLIGPSTASSAEILAVFLKQLSNTRLFGSPTGGFCNATEGFLFKNNQGYLLLTVNKIADAHRKVYEDMFVTPDVLIDNRNDNFTDLRSDPTFKAAYHWLQEQ